MNTISLTCDVIPAAQLTAHQFNTLVDVGYAAAEPEQPKSREFFNGWVNHMLQRPDTVFVIYSDADGPVACYGIVDVSYGGAYNTDEWQNYMKDNNLPAGKNIWGVMEYRYILPEFKGLGIATSMMRSEQKVMIDHTQYQYIFVPSEGYGSTAAKQFHEKYYTTNYNCETASFDNFSVKYVKLPR